MAFEMETGPENVVNIKVVGVGGGGNNVVNRYAPAPRAWTLWPSTRTSRC